VVEQVIADPLVVIMLANLQQRGFVTEIQDASRVELLHDAPGQAYRLGDGWLHVHRYADAPAAQAAARRILADRSSVSSMDWVAPPHFFLCDRLIALYLGRDEQVVGALGELCAPPFYTTKPPISESAAPPPGFALRFEYGPCVTDVLDTFEHTYTQDRGSEPALTIPLVVPNPQLYAIYAQVVEIDFFSYPAQFVVQSQPSIAEYQYVLTVRDGGRTHTVTWHDASLAPTTGKAEQLRQLFALINETIQAQPDVQQVPPRLFGCQ
jgi:hypothetical protein